MSKRLLASVARVLAFCLLCAPALSFGCIWVNGTTLDGLPHSYSPGGQMYFLQRAMDETPQERLKALRSSRVDSDEISSEGELHAVEAMLSGNPQAAVSLLQEIERATPGKYSTAANLGTAYELAGDNENALIWITEGITRNKDSHEGTEWLHQRILETKIRLATDPRYLASHRVIPLPDEFKKKTRVNVGGTERGIDEIEWAIIYQLRERMVFVKPPDPIVADLLYTLALIKAHTEVVEVALKTLEKAKLYGFADPSLLKQTAARYEAAIFRRKIYTYTRNLVLAAAFFGGLYFLYRKKIFFLSHAAYVKHRDETARQRRNKVPLD